MEVPTNYMLPSLIDGPDSYDLLKEKQRMKMIGVEQRAKHFSGMKRTHSQMSAVEKFGSL